MPLLLDTHVLIWTQFRPENLNPTCLSLLANEPIQFLSAASVWEAAIKTNAGKLSIPRPLESLIDEAGYKPLEISLQHAKLAGSLPLHHRDPFDRMLIAQAVSEGLTLVTADRSFEPYGLSVVWAR